MPRISLDALAHYYLCSFNIAAPLGDLSLRQIHTFFWLLDAKYPLHERALFMGGGDGKKIMQDQWKNHWEQSEHSIYRITQISTPLPPLPPSVPWPPAPWNPRGMFNHKTTQYQKARAKYESLPDYQKDEFVTIDYLIKNFGACNAKYRKGADCEDADLRVYWNCLRIFDHIRQQNIPLPPHVEEKIQAFELAARTQHRRVRKTVRVEN